jgi:hypothetical protein
VGHAGTLHLLPADDLPLWHVALSTRRYRKPGLWRRFGLALHELDQLTEAIGDALNGCDYELAQEVGQFKRELNACFEQGAPEGIALLGGDDRVKEFFGRALRTGLHLPFGEKSSRYLRLVRIW